ncbi:MAG: ABC transporter ATP-binding protein [Clostridium argentinense]|uniref:ABC transporter ATP-binding protein n=1 Tax=Clostridium faecium TaxID=2762223 RepID=A0ABR8YUS2_9CLOT|nr:ABC transporter ATP-binding protein [Clostridium faecium]MBD8047944.1 ABC transporter ATP-binding protein [Clostridium faecium]MBS5825174.1 ABC transporter ATP-binding protein [Clostridium argentinense]MDU1350045.1 ABC transporter ATP-binding protein [Clostridium argentinense]
MENFNLEEESLMKQYDSKLMKRLLKFAKPYKAYILGVIVIMFIVTCLDLLRPYIIKTTIDNDINPSKSSYTITEKSVNNSIKIKDDFYVVNNGSLDGKKASLVYDNKKIYVIEGEIKDNLPYVIEEDKLIQGKNSYSAYEISKEEVKILRSNNLSSIGKNAVYILVISILIFILNYIQIFILQYTGQKIVYNIRDTVFKHVEGLSLSFFDKNPVGRLVTRVTNDVETLNEMYTSVLVYLFKDFFLITGIIIAMFLLDVKLALITIVTLPLIILVSYVFKKYDRDAYRKVRSRLSKINSSLSENISGMKIVQIYGKEDKKYREFDEINTAYSEAAMGQIKVFAIFRPVMDFIYQIALAILIWAGGKAVLNADIHIGVLYAFISYIQQFFQPIFDLSEKFDIMQSAMASAERIFMILDTDTTIKNPEKPVEVERFNGEIEFKNVWFAYNSEEWVLRDVSFKINVGETIAFVGATGAGKTSIISLISRLYDIQKGEILIDGINIKNMRKEDLRRNLATVLQDVFLFTGDIKSNVRLNNENISDEEIIKSCEYVNANIFIEKLPEKYDAPVNERGSTFSQGERQLIAFARALAFNPPILVLDEATANIDTETESLIQDALGKLTEGRTTIIVAHRLSTIKNADKIIVLHKGKIREVGRHEELLEKGGLYSNLYRLQYAQH